MTNPTPALVAALQVVAGNCDGAHDRDGTGFNGTDAQFGRAIAAVPPESWRPGTEATVYRMLRKYRGQIAAGGIAWDSIPVPADPAAPARDFRAIEHDGERFVLRFPYMPDLVEAARRIPSASWNRGLRAWTADAPAASVLRAWAEEHGFHLAPSAQTAIESAVSAGVSETAPAPAVGTVTRDGDFLAIEFAYDASLVAQVRLIPGRAWDSGSRHWRAPITSLAAVAAFAEGNGLIMEGGLAAAAVELPPASVATVSVEGGQFALRFPYDRDLIDAARNLPGAKWSRARGAWTVPTDCAMEVLDFITVTSAYVADSATAHLEQARAALEQISASSAADADLEIPGLGGELRPFQRAGVAYAIRARRTFIGDEMGLGKTVQGLATLHALDAFPALIVCPASLRENWAREARKWLPGRTVGLIGGTRPEVPEEWADITIVNYDVLQAWVGTLPPLRGLVVDESHYAKNAKAQRTKALIQIADRVSADGCVLNLTGTPVLNRPGELVSQLRILGRLGDFGGPTEFRRRYRASDPATLVNLNRRLRATCFVRRRKMDVLTELPPKVWSNLFIEGDPAVMAEYREAEAHLLDYLARRAREAAAAAGASAEDAQRAAWEAALRASAAEHLVAVSQLKRLAARAKMPAARAWTEDFLGSGKKLVSFGWHRDVVQEIADVFAGGTRIQGGLSNEERQAAVDRFQDDESQKVISCSIRAAGVGLTLTAASDVLFLEQGWTPGEMDQAADRCHRIGQTDSVTAWVMQTAGTIDEDIAALIAEKREVVDAATDGDYSDDSEDAPASVLGDLLVRMTERALSA